MELEAEEEERAWISAVRKWQAEIKWYELWSYLGALQLPQGALESLAFGLSRAVFHLFVCLRICLLSLFKDANAEQSGFRSV